MHWLFSSLHWILCLTFCRQSAKVCSFPRGGRCEDFGTSCCRDCGNRWGRNTLYFKNSKCVGFGCTATDFLELVVYIRYDRPTYTSLKPQFRPQLINVIAVGQNPLIWKILCIAFVYKSYIFLFLEVHFYVNKSK